MAEPTQEMETPLFKKIVPARGAAQKAAANLKQQYVKQPRAPIPGIESKANEESGGAHAADNGGIQEGMGSVSRGKGSDSGYSRRLGGGRRQAGANNNRTRTTVLKYARASESDAKPSPKNSSLLTPPEVSPPAKRPRPASSSTPSKRTKVASLCNPGSSGSVATASPTASRSSGIRGSYVDTSSEGDLVWVRLNPMGDTIDLKKNDESESYWWPAQVTDDNISQIDAKLFGDDGRGPDRPISISSPSSNTILSFRHQGRIRFSPTNFALASIPAGVDPFQAQTSAETNFPDLRLRFKTALNLALMDDGDDELPDPFELLHMTSNANWRGKRKRKRNGDNELHGAEPAFTPSPSRFEKAPPAPLDEHIKLGEEDGELVLARDHKGRPDHWPARVVGVSRNKKNNWLYEVCFMDGKKKKMDRKCFFASDEEGFATCQMGKWRTEFPVSDSEGIDSEMELRNRELPRHRSPSPSRSDLEDITDPQEFSELPLRDQMRYVYPFLCHTIKREYQPAFERHDAFMKGGKARGNLTQMSSSRGKFSENEVRKISTLVRRTMLRDERWAERVYDSDDARDLRKEGNHLEQGLDGAKANVVVDGAAVDSPDLYAAVALTGLRSSEESNLHALPASPNAVVKTSPTADVPYMRGPDASHVSESHMTPPLSMVPAQEIDDSSDMEMASDEENDASEMVRPEFVIKDEKTSNSTAESHVSQKSPANISPVVHIPSPQVPSVPQNADDLASDAPVNFPTPRKRPIGCPAYENLSRSERSLYCADILLFEAVLHLHLLRTGRRSSAHILTPEKETALYEEGKVFLDKTEVHWVTQIVSLRRIAENAFMKKRNKQEAMVILAGGTSTRPKMVKSKE